MAARTVITEQPAEGGHIGFGVTFYDENDVTVIPQTAEWTLTDENGRVIDTATVASLATTITILIKGSTQLGIPDPLLLERHLLVQWTFNSDLGNDIPENHEIEFQIQKLTAVT